MECCDEEITSTENRRKVAAIGKCGCGVLVHLGDFTNTCLKCGADYNWNGARLAPREQWGQETGEHYLDILNIP